MRFAKANIRIVSLEPRIGGDNRPLFLTRGIANRSMLRG